MEHIFKKSEPAVIHGLPFDTDLTVVYEYVDLQFNIQNVELLIDDMPAPIDRDTGLTDAWVLLKYAKQVIKQSELDIEAAKKVARENQDVAA